MTQQKIILVADDDPDTLTIVTGVIEVLGHKVVGAADGRQALDFFHQHQPDLCILDVMMPGMSGTEVCTEIKKEQGGELIPVLMLTARDSIQDKVGAFELGADDYVTKPFNYQELQARVKALLRVRELNLNLSEKNREIQEMQERMVQQERQALVGQLAGTAAHQLGQPLSAIMLNLHLIEALPKEDQRAKGAVMAIKQDSARMAEIIEKLRSVDAAQTRAYFGEDKILDIEKKK